MNEEHSHQTNFQDRPSILLQEFDENKAYLPEFGDTESEMQRKNRFIENNKSKSAAFADEKQKKSIFPEHVQCKGFLDVRTKDSKPWKRRYFCVSNNFLLAAATPHADKLEMMLPLEGAANIKSSDMTFELQSSRKTVYFRAPNPNKCTLWIHAIEKASKLKIKDIYRFMYSLGTGQGDTKVIAGKHKVSGQECAIKIIKKQHCDRKMLRTEIQILKKIDSPYIVSIYDLVETKKTLYIVMEKCEGGELFDRIAELDEDTGFSPSDTCRIMHQVCTAVQYMHSMHIVHRDLKPENILCVKPQSIAHIKLCDFGISKITKPNSRKMTTLCGTMNYTAPEVLAQKKAYDLSVDYWSIGVIMYILLCGYPPFYGESDSEVTNAILNDELIFFDDDWAHIDNEIQMTVRGLLNRNPKERLTPEHVLKLTWKISNKTLSFKRSQKRFKKTVLQMKFKRFSLSGFEKNSTISSAMFQPRQYESSSKTKVLRSNDDMCSPHQSQIDAQKYEKRMEAFRGKRFSKGTEQLMTLRLPAHGFQTGLDVIQDK